MGYTSILFWLFAQFPQLIENTRNGNSDSLSLYFLANWLTGDFANLIGCIFTNQLPFQTYLALYFVWIDTSLFVQSLYYKLKGGSRTRSRSRTATNSSEQDNEQTPLLGMSFVFIGVLFSSLASSAPVISSLSLASTSVDLLVEPPPPPVNASYQLGRLFAWICTFLYLSSRLPQIYKNFERKSCQGLAMSMFGCALMGNVTYSTSILVKSVEPAYLYNALPYLLGSGGTVVFDIVIFTQYLAYGDALPKEEPDDEEEGEEEVVEE